MLELIVIYVLLGVGVLGASHAWTHRGWAWYSVLFPAHAILISFGTTGYQIAKVAFKNHLVQFVSILLLLWCLSWLMQLVL